MTDVSLLHFEDFEPGVVAEYGRKEVARDELLDFAARYDPQPFHLDEAAARASLLGGLACSGWHVSGMLMRMNTDEMLNRAAALGAPGISEVKWLVPVRPGDVLRARSTVLDTRPSRSRPDRGFVEFRFELLNQRAETVMMQRNVVIFARRHPAAAEPPAGGERAAGKAPAGAGDPAVSDSQDAGTRDAGTLPFLEDFAIGEHHGLGAHAFTGEEIIAFARDFDPQYFHVDPEAARHGPFGALAASGWHTAAMWMRGYVDWMLRRTAHARSLGRSVPAVGPSPGFRDLNWLKPVYAGDTITYGMTVEGTRPNISRPEWGLLTCRNQGVNQSGVKVFEFVSTVFWGRRPATA